MSPLETENQRLHRQLANADAVGEAVMQERDQLRRDLAAVTRERDEAVARLAEPVPQLLVEMEDLRHNRDLTAKRAREAVKKAEDQAQAYRDTNRKLVADLEIARRAIRGLEQRLIDAADLREQLVEAKTALNNLYGNVRDLEGQPESPILREKSARDRAVAAAVAADFAADNEHAEAAHAFASVATAWAQIAALPEKRSND